MWKKFFIVTATLQLVYLLAGPAFLPVASAASGDSFNLTGRSAITPSEVRALAFLNCRMQSGDGIIYYLVNPKRNSKTSVVESLGQAMEYAALTGDKNMFDAYAESTERYFKDKKDYYYYWEITVKNKRGAPVTALVDDLRIFKAYDIANSKKMGDYAGKMKELAAEIYFLETEGGKPVSFYNNDDKSRDTGVNMFYLDTEVMDSMAAIDARWKDVASAAKRILRRMPEHELGFYPFRYEADKDDYTINPTTNMVENLYTAIFAHYADADVGPFADFLRREAEAGVLYNVYKTDEGTPNEKYESTAVYALAARFMYILGDRSTASFFYEKMLATQIGMESTFMGGFSMDSNESVYAFDQLEAMLTIRRTDL